MPLSDQKKKTGLNLQQAGCKCKIKWHRLCGFAPSADAKGCCSRQQQIGKRRRPHREDWAQAFEVAYMLFFKATKCSHMALTAI